MENIGCETILNLDQQFRYCSKISLFQLQAAILFRGSKHFKPFWQRALCGILVLILILFDLIRSAPVNNLSVMSG